MFGGTSYNVTFFGHQGVGKSSIINGYNDENSSLLHSDVTIKTISRNGVEIKFRIEEFDASALDESRTIGGLAFSAHCFVIVCDVTSKEAVASLDIWLNEINTNTINNAKNTPLVVIGNKIDKQDKKETIVKNIQEWCVKQNTKFFKINAKERIETEKIFLELCKIIQKYDKERTKSISSSVEPFQIEEKTQKSYDPHNDSLNKTYIDEDRPYDYSVIVIGASGTGKTLLSKRFVDRSNWIDAKSKNKCTTAPDFFQTTREHKGERIRLQIWDTAGQERFQSTLGSYYRKAECCLIVFDVTDRASFDSIDQHRTKLLEHVSEKQVSIILVGNKSDGAKENNITDHARIWCQINKAYGYYEVSAKDNADIDPLLEAILESCSLRLPMLKESKKLNQSSNKSKKRGCC